MMRKSSSICRKTVLYVALLLGGNPVTFFHTRSGLYLGK